MRHSRGKALFSTVVGMHGKDVDNDAVIINRVDETMLAIDAPGPHASKRKAQRFRLADARVWMLGDVGKQELDAVHDFHISALDEGVVMRYSRLGEDYSVHVIRSKSSSIVSPSC